MNPVAQPFSAASSGGVPPLDGSTSETLAVHVIVTAGADERDIGAETLGASVTRMTNSA